MRDTKVVKDASVCEDATALLDPEVLTANQVLAHDKTRCPVFEECNAGTLLGPGKLNCIPRQGQEVARYAVDSRHSVIVEMRDFRSAPLFPPAVKGFIDPYDDPSKIITDKDEICSGVERWANIVQSGSPSPVQVVMPPDHCHIHTTFTDGCRKCGLARVILLDRTDLVMPNGIAQRVPRDKCRCPVLRVGDFCPIHGG